MSVTHLNPERMHDLTMPRDLRANALQAHWRTLDNRVPYRHEGERLRRELASVLGVDATGGTITSRMAPRGGRWLAMEVDGLWFCYRDRDGLCLLDREGAVYQVGSLADLGRLLSEIGDGL